MSTTTPVTPAPPSTVQEDYLEAILRLSAEQPDGAQVSELATALNVKPPTVVEMIARLRAAELVTHAPRERVRLTARGLAAAQEVHARHTVLRRFFTDILRVTPAVAESDACKVEHTLDPETMARLRDFLEHAATDHLERDRTVPLTLLHKGDRGVLRRITGGHGKHARLAAMGVRVGCSMQVLQNSGAAPVMVKVGNVRVAIGRGLATALHLAVEEPHA
jgi:DtxR family Mn-dependent transcriptional regulator